MVGALSPLVFSFLLVSVLSFSCSEARNFSFVSPVGDIITEEVYNSIFLHKDDEGCSKGFYTYAAFIEATKSFPRFASSGKLMNRKRELAAFLAQISHETTGGWATAPDGAYSWGLCYKEELKPLSTYCNSTDKKYKKWPCYPGKSYKGRGPIQLSWNFNYGPVGQALGFDGLRNPELVSEDPIMAFKSALWFWMKRRKTVPSCHNVIVGNYNPKGADIEANRTAGFGMVTNIINGGLECGLPNDPRVNDRIGFYKRYAALLNVDTGANLDCDYQKSF